MPAKDPSFSDLLALHDGLAERFARHQEALLARDLAAAADALGEFDREIRDHIRHEEESLLPVYRERCPEAPGAAADLFVAEHRKIEAFLEELCAGLARLLARGAEARETIRLLDREATFKALLEHHDRRERSALYPALDAATSLEERARLLEWPARAR